MFLHKYLHLVGTFYLSKALILFIYFVSVCLIGVW